MARCPHTALTIPECSCRTCIEEQLRRVAPALLEHRDLPPDAPDQAAVLPEQRRAA